MRWRSCSGCSKRAWCNRQIWLGIFFQALILCLPAGADVQERHQFFVAVDGAEPGFCDGIRTLIFCMNPVSWIRWVGVVLIMLGAACISYSEHAKEKPLPAAPKRKTTDEVISASTVASCWAAN